MKEKSSSKCAFSGRRLVLASGLFLISVVLAFSSMADLSWTGLVRAHSQIGDPMLSVPLNSTLGHSHWNEIMATSAAAVPAFGRHDVSHSFAMRGAGGRARGSNSVSRGQTLTPLVSAAVAP